MKRSYEEISNLFEGIDLKGINEKHPKLVRSKSIRRLKTHERGEGRGNLLELSKSKEKTGSEAKIDFKKSLKYYQI